MALLGAALSGRTAVRLAPAIMCDAGSSARDAALSLRTLSDKVDLGDAGASGSSALEAMQAKMNRRLESLGASEGAPPKKEPKLQRGAFSVSDASAGREAAEERLRRMRMKDTGELETVHATDIAKSQRVARQWLDAGLNERAMGELKKVEKLCSYKTSVGADFQLFFATVAEACGRPGEARRVRQRVMSEAGSSSQRWQAERALEKSSPSVTQQQKASAAASSSELSQLFRPVVDDQW